MATVSACSTVEQDFKDDELFTKEKKEVVITATVEGQPETRTVLKSDDLSVLWRPADEIKVFSAGEASKFISQNSENQKAVNFLGTISVITGTAEGTDIDTHIYGLYPYTDEATMTDGSFTTALPSVQTGLAESFDDDLFISIGRSYTFSMGFWNVCSGYRFSFTEGGYQSVTMSSNDGTPLAGTFVVTFDDNGKPVISSHPVPSSSVTMNAPEGGFVPNTYYYLVVLPGTHAEGFTFTAVNASGETGTYAINEEKTMNRSKFKQVEGLDEMLDFTSTTPPDNEIWYTSVSGNVTYPTRRDNWGQTIVSNTYENGKGVITFSGPIDRIPPSAFYYNSWGGGTLTSLCMPDSVTEIGPEAFYQQGELESISLSKNLTNINAKAFYRCSSLESFILPESLLYLGVDVFTYSGLTDFTVLTDRSFDDRGLAYLVSSTYYIERFHGPYASYDGKFVVINNELVLAASGTEASIMVIPEGVQTIQPYVFWLHFNLKSVDIPASISSIGYESFRDCTHLEQISIRSETPPSVSDYSFDNTNDCPIIVPSQSVEAYKSAWPQYQHRIRSEGIELGESSLNLLIQQEKSISATCYSLSYDADKSIIWSSSNPLVATVENGVVRCISGGQTTISASSAFGTASCEVTVFEPVDLGLSVKWCPFNLGATSSEEAGDYYAWGETNPKPTYTSGNYMYTGTSSVLPLDADAAHVQLGGNWRMPTKEEWEELIENCYFSLVNRNGTYGWVIRGGDGYSGNSIFLPFVGYRIGETLYDDSDAHYWSSTKPFHYHAYWDYDGNRDDEITSSCSINCGLTIRPVYVE